MSNITTEEKDRVDEVVLSNEGATGLRDAIGNRQAKQTPHYVAEYGVRDDDGAMIFHFYPPGTDWSEYPPTSLGEWPAAYKMDHRLERAMGIVFDVRFVKATYTEEMASFCIIVKGLGKSPDPWPLVNRFFDRIDAPL